MALAMITNLAWSIIACLSDLGNNEKSGIIVGSTLIALQASSNVLISVYIFVVLNC
ncbi:hypothetical protein D3C85_1576160 [compost metagenome]